MKQGKLYFRILQLILLAAIVLYLGYAVFSAVSDPLTTTTIMEYETGEAYLAEGYLARAETVLQSSYAINIPTRSEGEKVEAGGTVAAGYSDASVQSRQNQIASIQAQLAQLREITDTNLTTADADKLDESLIDTLAALSRAVVRRDASAQQTAAGSVKGLIIQRDIALGGSTGDSLRAQIAQLEDELRTLQSQSSGVAHFVTASESGWFSSYVDGYESVLTPASLDNVSVAEFDAIEPAETTAFGKLITSSTWYFVAKAPAALVETLSVGQSLSVQLTDYLSDTLSMRVETISAEEDGMRVLVLSSSEYLQEVSALRNVSAELIFASYRGLRVPKSAIRYQDGQAGVFVLDGAEANWKPVEILYDNGESFVVTQDKSNVSNLWAGDEVIVDAKDLYDGKVVQ